MEVSLIIIGALAIVGIALYLHDRYARRKPSQQEEEPSLSLRNKKSAVECTSPASAIRSLHR